MDLHWLILAIFVIGYIGITLEHTIKLDKLIPSIMMMTLCWAVITIGHLDVFDVNATLKKLVPKEIEEILLHHLGKTAEILVFLMGAMTIVEIIDYFNGFSTIKNYITTGNKKKLLWGFCGLAFILSAIIDNLTATIVLISIIRKLVEDNKVRIWFAGLIIIAANAGGAWSPIGDVTTTMLWIGKKVSAVSLAKYLLIPSLLCMVIPTWIASYLPIFKGRLIKDKDIKRKEINSNSKKMFYIGILSIIFVPIFKIVTHLPPYMGMMLSLSIVAIFATYYSYREFITHSDELKPIQHGPLHKALSNIEMPSILFFLGILLAVGALESIGMLFHFADYLNRVFPNTDIVVILLGLGSAVIDNVPLVAASIGMFSEKLDDPIWHFIAFSAGTGGSMLIIGSAAGVIAMGMEKINFMWYLKKISWLAAVGFLVGSLAFIGLRNFF